MRAFSVHRKNKEERREKKDTNYSFSGYYLLCGLARQGQLERDDCQLRVKHKSTHSGRAGGVPSFNPFVSRLSMRHQKFYGFFNSQTRGGAYAVCICDILLLPIVIMMSFFKRLCDDARALLCILNSIFSLSFFLYLSPLEFQDEIKFATAACYCDCKLSRLLRIRAEAKSNCVRNIKIQKNYLLNSWAHSNSD